MEAIPNLPDAHLAHAKKLVAERRTRNRCRYCYDRGYVGINQHNMLVVCTRCVDNDGVMEAWRAYVRETPELTALYGDYFEAEEEEQGGGGAPGADAAGVAVAAAGEAGVAQNQVEPSAAEAPTRGAGDAGAAGDSGGETG